MEPFQENEDDALVRLALTGNAAAFRRLVEKYEKGVFHFCLSRMRSPEEAEDAAQDVFLRAYVSLKTFGLDRSFKTWLFTIAANRLKSRGMKILRMAEKLQRFISEGGPKVSTANPAEDLENDERARRVRAAVGELPASLRDAVYLHYFEDMSVKEIAEVLGAGEEAVKSRLFRGRVLLRKKLEDPSE